MADTMADAEPAVRLQHWPIICEVRLTKDEYDRLMDAALSAETAKASWWSSWWLVVVAIGIGFAFAGLTVGFDVVEPEHAAGLAAGGFLTFWAGCWAQWAHERGRYRRRSRAAVMQHYRVVLAADDISGGILGRDFRLAWWRIATADVRHDLVRLWTDYGSVLGLPVRCLPDGWSGEAVAARVRELAAAERQARAASPEMQGPA